MKRFSVILIAFLLSVCASAVQPPQCAKAGAWPLQTPGEGRRMARFAATLKATREHADSCATIWHIGGSHVQAGWFSSRLRNNFDSLGLYPRGSRGFIFPYPLAHTNFDHSYSVHYDGEWTGSRSSNPNRDVPVPPQFGIMGIAAYTTDTLAAFTLRMPEPFTGLHIIGEGSFGCEAPVVYTAADSLLCDPDPVLGGFLADFPEPVDSVRVRLRLRDGEFFTVTGLLPESIYTGGVRYLSTGVNGARTNTWTERCPQFEREMALVHPDLVIFGLGINDSTCPARDFNPEKFKANYRKLIDIILREAPHCAFIFITNNDSYRYVRRGMVHNDNGEAVRKAMTDLAVEYDACVWDLFGMMGGNGSANEWRDASLMKNDRLHFTREGYELLGDLLYRAITDECRK